MKHWILLMLAASLVSAQPKKVLAIGQVLGYQHDETTDGLATIWKMGKDTGLWDTYIRTDSNIASYKPLMTTGQPASGGPSFNNVDAIFFMGHRDVAIDDQQKADLLKCNIILQFYSITSNRCYLLIAFSGSNE